MNRRMIGTAAVLWMGLTGGSALQAATFGFVDEFSGPDTNGWQGGTFYSNPGTGGVGGAGDGYLLLDQGVVFNFGSHSLNPAYQGDWIAAGITEVSFYLNDVGADQLFEIHFMISNGSFATTYQYNIGFSPPENCWQRFTVDLTDPSKWTRTRGTASFQSVLQTVERVHLRHDKPPFGEQPDGIAGDIGVDRIRLGTVTPVCNDPFADVDGDGDVDQEDFGVFQACLTGGCGGVPAACECFDQDGDGNVDLDDFALFNACSSGPAVPADPACDD